MIYLYYGDDVLSISEALNKLIENVQPAEVRDVNVITLESPELDEFRAASSIAPFLSNRRLIIVKGLFSTIERREKIGPSQGDRSKRQEWKNLTEYLGTIPDATDVVFIGGVTRRNNPLMEKLLTVAETKKFALPRGPNLHNWIRERAQKKGARIHPRVASTLADSVGNNLAVLDSELEKLSLYCGDREILPKDVERIVSYTVEANVFGAIDAMLDNRPGVAFTQISRYIEAGSHPLQLLSLLTTQIRRLLLANELRAQGIRPAEIGQRLNISGYPLQKILQQEAKFTRRQLVHVHNLLLQTDITFKTSATDNQLVLDLLVAQLCAVVRQRADSSRR